MNTRPAHPRSPGAGRRTIPAAARGCAAPGKCARGGGGGRRGGMLVAVMGGTRRAVRRDHPLSTRAPYTLTGGEYVGGDHTTHILPGIGEGVCVWGVCGGYVAKYVAESFRVGSSYQHPLPRGQERPLPPFRAFLGDVDFVVVEQALHCGLLVVLPDFFGVWLEGISGGV